MANELSFANLETDAGLAHYLSGEIHANLYDPTDLRAVMRRKPFGLHMGSETTRTTKYNRGQVFAPASTEISGGGSNQAIGAGSFDITFVRNYMKWTTSEMWDKVAPTGSLDIDLLAGIIAEATGLRITDILCALFPSVSGSVGSATEQMHVDFLYDGQYGLNNSRVPPPYTSVLDPHCFNMLQKTLRGEGGVVSWQGATAEMIKAKGPGFKGEFGNHLIWDSNSVPLDGGSTYRQNVIMGAGAFEYVEAPPGDLPGRALPVNATRIVDGVVRLVLDYDPDNAVGVLYGDYWPGVSEVEDARAKRILALAA